MTAMQSVQPISGKGVLANWRLAPKLLTAFLAVVIIPLGIFAMISVPQTRDALLEQGATTLMSHTSSTGNAIEQYLLRHREDIVANSLLPTFQNFAINPKDAQAQATALKELKILSNKKFYESIAIVNTDGTIILSSSDADVNTNVQFRPYFIEAMKANAGYISDPSVSVVTNQPAIFFSAPILDSGGNIRAVIRSRLSLWGIWELVEGDKDVAGRGTYGLLLDDQGIRLATSLSKNQRDQVEGSLLLYSAIAPVPADVEKSIVSEKRFGNATSSKVQVMAIPDVANAIATHNIKTFETTSDNSPERHYAAMTTLSTKPWHYVLMTPLSTFTSTADTLRTISIFIVVVVGALTAILAIVLARQITRPIIQLTKIADRISLGELDAKIDIDRKDEIGELAEAISRMQASLQAAIERLRARRSAG
ncbi:MAG: HAMP domain-containing protein [Chloroflexi bacterium]|nr:HAMP domain-containing protein [Chloroflexota bacterium]